jgi:hypothetical protein
LSAIIFNGVPCKPGFFLPVRVLSRLFRRRFLEELQNAHRDGQLQFFGEHSALSDPTVFAVWLAPLSQCEWVVYAKRPFAGPKAMLAYLSRYTHRVAISNHRLIACDERGVTFRWKDYRAHGRTRYKTMTLSTDEFMRRFLLHVLPSGFHRIRYYELLANANRKSHIATVHELLHQNSLVFTESDVQESFRLLISRQAGDRPPGESSPIRRLVTGFRTPSRVKFGHPVSGCAARCVSCRRSVTTIQPVCGWCGKRQ